MKKHLFCLTISLILFALCCAAASANTMADAEPIDVGGPVTAVIETGRDKAWFSFTPEETCAYCFFSSAEGSDTYGELYDADGNMLTSDDDGGNYGNFRIEYVFESGKTYYLAARYYSSYATGSFEVQLRRINLVSVASNEDGDTYEDIFISPGETVDLKAYVEAADPSVLKYEWKRLEWVAYIWSDIEDNNSPEYTTAEIFKHEYYECHVIDEDGTEKSTFFDIMIENHFSPTAGGSNSSSADIKVPYGQSCELKVNVSADNTEGMTFIWNDPNLDEPVVTDSPVYTIESVTENVYISCRVLDCYENDRYVDFYLSIENHFSVRGNNSSSNWVDVFIPYSGSTVLTVTVTADDMTDIRYEWIDRSTWSRIDNDNSPQLLIENFTEPAEYRCRVYDRFGSSREINFTLYIENHLTATANDSGRPSVDLYIAPGNSVDLTANVSADDMTDISYRWRNNDGNTWSDLDADGPSIHLDDVTRSGRYECRVTDRFGMSMTLYFYVTVQNHFEATGNDTGRTSVTVAVPYGESAAMTVNVTGDDLTGVTYAWEVSDSSGWRELEDTGSSLTVEEVTEKQTYYCRVTDRFGTYKSVFFDVGVENHLTARMNFSSRSVPYGGSAVMTVAVTADDMTGLTYEWTRQSPDWKSFDNNHSPELLADYITEFTEYRCTVRDRFGNTANARFTLTVENHLTVTANDSVSSSLTLYISPGDSVDLTANVSADDITGISYQWKMQADNTWSDLPDSGPSIHLDNVTRSVRYYCTVKDRFGTTNSASFSIVIQNHFAATANDTGKEYATLTVPYGEPVTLTVNVTGDDLTGVTYAWEVSNSEGRGYLGDIGSTLTVGEITKRQTYYCAVTDRFGTRITVSFSVGVENHLQIRLDRENSVLQAEYGGTAVLKALVSADNLEGIRYQWYYMIYNEAERYYTASLLSGADSDTLTIENVTNAGRYECRVTDCYGNSNSISTEITVKNNLRVYVNGTYIQTVNAGDPVTLSVTVTADDMSGISYQWYRDDVMDELGRYRTAILTGETSAVLTVPEVTEFARYSCEVLDRFGNRGGAIFYVCINGFFNLEREGGYSRTAVEGGSVELKVKVTAEHPETVTYTWTKYSNATNQRDVIEGADTGTLLLENVTAAAEGDYTCIAEDEYGNRMSVSYSVVLTTEPPITYIRGDVDNDKDVDSDDAIYLLRHTLNGSRYPINQPGDMNGDNKKDSDDAIYLLRHTLNRSRYPLH